MLLLVALPAVLWIWRRAVPEVVMIAVLLTFFVTSAGFGVTYLIWPVPLAIVFATRRSWRWIWPASAYAAVANLYAPSATVLTLLSIPVIVAIVFALPFDQRVTADPEHVPDSGARGESGSWRTSRRSVRDPADRFVLERLGRRREYRAGERRRIRLQTSRAGLPSDREGRCPRLWPNLAGASARRPRSYE